MLLAKLQITIVPNQKNKKNIVPQYKTVCSQCSLQMCSFNTEALEFTHHIMFNSLLLKVPFHPFKSAPVMPSTNHFIYIQQIDFQILVTFFCSFALVSMSAVII